jgi:hypothetical protein
MMATTSVMCACRIARASSASSLALLASFKRFVLTTRSISLNSQVWATRYSRIDLPVRQIQLRLPRSKWRDLGIWPNAQDRPRDDLNHEQPDLVLLFRRRDMPIERIDLSIEPS